MGNQKKILQFVIRNTRGGVTRYAMENWKFIDSSRFQFDYATCSKVIDFEDEIIKSGCKLHYIDCYAEENPARFSEALRKILSEGYDAVHLHTSWWKSFLAEEAAKEMGVPKIIVHSHSTSVGQNDGLLRQKELIRHKELKEQFTSGMATDFCACSHAAADWLFGPQIPREQIQVLHNAIDADRFVYQPEIQKAYRTQLGIENKFVIGHTGRFCAAKNHIFLIDAFRDVCKQHDNAVLLLCGTGPLLDEVKRHVSECGLSDNVLFLGMRDDMAALYQAMDLFCLPSLFEGLPIVGVEAQTAGLKCLFSDLITTEAKVTENADFLPLDHAVWVKQIMDYAAGYERRNMIQEITAAGYNIREGIKVLEALYMA